MEEDQKQHKILNTMVNDDEKKIIRREVEKQRRMEMSILCSSLRSSLPFHLIKGKRSVSDHIGEAANYVQILKKKVNELEKKRDKLREIISSRMVGTGNELPTDPSNLVKCVNINLIPDGLEIVICSGFEDCSSRLSDLIKIIVQEGCDVVHCVTNQVNGKIFHTIKSEVEDLTHFDLARLQNKLDHAILLAR